MLFLPHEQVVGGRGAKESVVFPAKTSSMCFEAMPLLPCNAYVCQYYYDANTLHWIEKNVSK